MLYVSLLMVSLVGLMKVPVMIDGKEKQEYFFKSKQFPSSILYTMFTLFLFNIVFFGKLDDYRGLFMIMVMQYVLMQFAKWLYRFQVYSQEKNLISKIGGEK